jgi:hypothetical protein
MKWLSAFVSSNRIFLLTVWDDQEGLSYFYEKALDDFSLIEERENFLLFERINKIYI